MTTHTTGTVATGTPYRTIYNRAGETIGQAAGYANPADAVRAWNLANTDQHTPGRDRAASASN